jgi:hypothetical protein
MAKSVLRLVSPATENRTVERSMPSRRPNADLRPREHLTEREVEKLIAVARGNRWGQRDATMILLAFRHGLPRTPKHSIDCALHRACARTVQEPVEELGEKYGYGVRVGGSSPERPSGGPPLLNAPAGSLSHGRPIYGLRSEFVQLRNHVSPLSHRIFTADRQESRARVQRIPPMTVERRSCRKIETDCLLK